MQRTAEIWAMLPEDKPLHKIGWYQQSTRWAFLSQKSGVCGMALAAFQVFGMAGVMAFRFRNPEYIDWIDELIETLGLKTASPKDWLTLPTDWSREPAYDGEQKLIFGSCEPDWMPQEPYKI